jgi:RHS repeat-associated protein
MPLPGRQLTPGSYRYGFNGMEKDGEEWSGNAANQLDFGARIYDPRIGRWLAIDPLSIKYPSISPYAFVANNVINAVDPDGKKIIFVNGHFQDNAFGDWFNIGRKGGREYWSDKFISGAQEFFNDKGATQFLDGSSSVGFDMDGEDRYNAGYEWAKANYETLITDLEEGEVFNMVTSSEGAAHGAGVAAYLIEKGHTVKTVVHLSPDEGNDFDTPTQPETYQLDFEDDWVTGNERVDGVDKRGTVKENGSTPHGRHRSNTVWDKVKDLKTVQTQENWDSNGNTFTSQVKGTTPNDTKFIEIDEKPIKNE